MDKLEALRGLIHELKREIDAQSQSARAAHQAATHEESRAEDRHDTFAIEASYLAAGQAARIAELEKTTSEFREYLELSSQKMTQVQAGALIQVRLDEKQEQILFYALRGGGLRATVGKESVSVVTAESPLGQALADAKVGDEIELETKTNQKYYQILAIG